MLTSVDLLNKIVVNGILHSVVIIYHKEHFLSVAAMATLKKRCLTSKVFPFLSTQKKNVA